jgi:hypothetical protein
MTSISFIFSINDNDTTYFGKIILNDFDNISRDIDIIIRPYILKVLKEILKIPIDELRIGILGIGNNNTSESEMEIFAVYIAEDIKDAIDESYYCYIDQNPEYVAKYYSYGRYLGTIKQW